MRFVIRTLALLSFLSIPAGQETKHLVVSGPVLIKQGWLQNKRKPLGHQWLWIRFTTPKVLCSMANDQRYIATCSGMLIASQIRVEMFRWNRNMFVLLFCLFVCLLFLNIQMEQVFKIIHHRRRWPFYHIRSMPWHRHVFTHHRVDLFFLKNCGNNPRVLIHLMSALYREKHQPIIHTQMAKKVKRVHLK